MAVHGLALVHPVRLSIRMIHVNDHRVFQCSSGRDSFDFLASELIRLKYSLLVPIGPIHVILERGNTEWMPQRVGGVEDRSPARAVVVTRPYHIQLRVYPEHLFPY